jgi:hypothetical protein
MRSKLMRSKLLQYVLAGTTGLVFCGTTHAQDLKATGVFGWLGVGKAYEIDKGHLYWMGEFRGTFTNDKGNGSLFHLAGEVSQCQQCR